MTFPFPILGARKAGSRISGATATSPNFTVSSGVIANVNDNSPATTATFTLTNVAAAAYAATIMARLALASPITLTKIEGIGLNVSSSSSSSGQWFAYSTNNGASWIQVGASFIWTSSPSNFDTGAISIAGVTDVAVAISNQNWSGFTGVIGDLNAYG